MKLFRALPHWIGVSVALTLTTIATDGPPRWPMFQKHLIDAGANEAATIADINGDGRLDIVSGENWFEAPDWKKHHFRDIPFSNGYISYNFV